MLVRLEIAFDDEENEEAVEVHSVEAILAAELLLEEAVFDCERYNCDREEESSMSILYSIKLGHHN